VAVADAGGDRDDRQQDRPVVSVYGGDGKRAQNAVTQDIAQAGSTFKPFGLIAGLEGKRGKGDCGPKAPDDTSLSLRSTFDGHSPQNFNGFKVSNFGQEQFGNIDLVQATTHSVNTVFVALNKKVGPEHTEDVAICAGYPPRTNGLAPVQSNVLGTSSPHPIDVARAFSTIAAQGVRHDSYVITKIVSAQNGAVIKRHTTTSDKQVFDPGVIADTTYAMQQVVKHGTATTVNRLGRPVAGKTGTTTDNKAAWFAGFTPQYTTVVVMYRQNAKGGVVSLQPWAGAGSEVTGGTLPARVWTTYMQDVLDGVPVADFPEPTNGGQDAASSPIQTQTETSTPHPSTTTSTQRPPPTPTPTPTGGPSPSPSVSAEPTPTFSPTPTRTRPGRPTPGPIPSPGD